MPYEVFSRKAPRLTSPAVTINPAGRIYLNQGATALFRADSAKGAAKFVLMFWDKASHKIAIQPTNKKDQNAFRVAYSHKGSGSMLNVKTFLDWINYDNSNPDTITLAAHWDEKNKWLEIEIPAERIRVQQQSRARSTLAAKKKA
jgi:hypothetical protein